MNINEYERKYLGDYSKLTSSVKALRVELGLTQVQFAKLLGTSQMTIHRWENETCPPYIDKFAYLLLTEYAKNGTN